MLVQSKHKNREGKKKGESLLVLFCKTLCHPVPLHEEDFAEKQESR